MILDPDISTDAEPSPLVSYLTAEMDACGGTGSLSPSQLQNVAEAVEVYLQDRQKTVVEANHLVLLASRALKSLGEADSARRLFLYGSGLVRPSEWAVTAGRDMWVLDLQQMTFKTDALIELLFFNSLRTVLSGTADIWDATQGQGVLGLQNVCSVATKLLGSTTRSASTLSDEIADTCTRTLARISTERGWTHVPDVLSLDLR